MRPTPPRASNPRRRAPLEGVIDHYDRARADDILAYEQLQTDIPMLVLANSLELEAIGNLRNVSNLGTSYKVLGPDELFDAYLSLSSNPVLELRRACERIISQIGRKPNRIGFDFLTWRAMQFNPAMQAIAPVHTTPAGLQLVTPKMLEQKLEDVLEPNSIKVTFGRYETRRGPQQGAKRSWLGADVPIAYVEEPSLKSIGAMHRFGFVGKNSPGDDGNPTDTIGVYTYPKPERGPDGSTIVRVRTNVDYKIVKTESLFVLKNVVDVTNVDLYNGELLAGRLLPGLGYFSLDDVCIGQWTFELKSILDRLTVGKQGIYVFDEGELGQPAFQFRRDEERLYVSLIDSHYDEFAKGDPNWKNVECDFDDFRTAVTHFLANLQREISTHAPHAARAWWRHTILRDENNG